MACYVDELWACRTTPRWPYKKACHLVADTIDELHTFATSIGLQRSWFQQHSRLPHYDLTASKRAVAIRAGAVTLSRHEMVARMMDPPIKEPSQ